MTSTPKQTTTTTAPWSGAQPYILENYAAFDKLLKDGAPKPYAGQTYNDQSQQTKDSLSQAEKIARGGDTSALTNATGAVNSVMTQSGQNKATDTLSQLQNGINLGKNPTDNIANMIANGKTAAAPGQFNQNFANPALASAAGYGNYTNAASGLQSAQANQLASGNNPAMDYLKGTASGANIGKNPALDAMVSNQQDAIATKLQNITNPALNSQAASLGRMGSGAFASQLNSAQTAAANEMSKVATDMYGNQYNQDVSNQMSAAGQYGNFANQDVANRMNANQALASTSNAQQQLQQSGTSLYGDLANSQEATRQNASNSANQQFNAGNQYQLQGAQLASNNYQSNIQNMLAANGQKMDAANASLSAQNALNGQKLQAANMAGQTYQNQYMPSQMLGQVGQTQDAFNDVKLQSQINSWDRAQQQPLQNIANFQSLLTNGGFNSTTTPVYSNTGAQVLGGLSSLAGLFSLCDVREKVVHAFLGYMPMLNGETIGIYQFTYRDDEDQNHWVGPMAQEVEAKTEAAVIEFNNRKVIDVEAFMKEAA